ncbi:MAG: ClpXP protease specificity-enhancing factor [Gammaproteobacteria bacterium]|nr:ClpXP protease specificity-enhancing factor [Gammaproteobacteria bacterium]
MDSKDTKPTTSSQPYLIRAIYQWIIDNDLTPYLLVDASNDDVVVPRKFVENDKIILNVAPRAVSNLELGNEQVWFDARFGGNPMHIQFPIHAVLAIYARENGQGMVFNDKRPPSSPDDNPTKPTRPALRVVK